MVQGPHSTSFFIKADTELQHMVENYYNLDINESIVDSRTELSQDECCFMASVEESTLLKAGHYEIPLPFRDRQYPVPNNCIQAEQRASWLKKRLKKNPRLLDYKAYCLQRYCGKGIRTESSPAPKGIRLSRQDLVHTTPWRISSSQTWKNTCSLRLFCEVQRKMS